MSSPSALRKRVVLSAILLMLLPQVAVVVSFLFTSRSSRTPLSRWPDRHQRGGLTTGHVSHHTNNKYSPDCLGQHRLLLLVKSKNQKSESTAGSASSKPKRTWEENFQKLKEYKAIHGDCSVPFRYNEDTRLGTFVSRQRQRDRKGILKEEERAKLDELGFDWTGKRILRPVSWNRKLQELKEYKEEHGHCLVNVHTRTPLGNWVREQRRIRKLLTESQRASLDELGFVWEESQKKRNDVKWDEKFDQLKDYKSVYGHAQVPNRWPENPPLGNWVSHQRTQYWRGLLPDDREAKLRSLGFIWSVFDTNSANYTKLDQMWLEKYEKLKEFKAILNHTNVPYEYQDDPTLGRWVSTQRKLHRVNLMRENRQKYLEEIGFEWDHKEQALERQWMDHYRDLVAFRSAHGHLNVTELHGPLYRFIRMQRELNANDKLDPRRKQMLVKIGFDWNFRPRSRFRK